MRVRLGTPVLHSNTLHRCKNTQRRALQIIAGNIPYDEACRLFELTSLSVRPGSLCSRLFRQLISQSHIVHGLLSAQRDDSCSALASSVRSAPSSLLQFRRDLKTALHVSVIVLFTIVSSCVTDCNFYYCKVPL